MFMRWLWKHKIHFLIWAVFGVYLLSASQLHTSFFLKNGKPLDGAVVLPDETGEIRYYVDELRPIYYEGEEVYMLKGWVFAPDIAQSPEYRKKLLLHSVGRDFVFEAGTVSRADLNQGMPQYSMNLDSAGFQVMIAKDVLPRDNYKIGFILEDEQGRVRVYRMVDEYIEREPNRLRFIGE